MDLLSLDPTGDTAGRDSAMDKQLIQRGVAIRLDASCNRNWVTLGPCGHLIIS